MEQTMFDKICIQLDLGTIQEPPKMLKGGFMHKMYSLFTTKGKYAVKLLNPHIMKRPDAAGNFRDAEQLEAILEQRQLPILPALIFHGKKMQELEGQYYYIFQWFDGKALKDSQITSSHCEKIGKVLANIHKTDYKEAEVQVEEMQIDWEFYISKMQSVNMELYQLLHQNKQLLHESMEKGNAAIRHLPQVQAICHNDLDSKNVLWNGDNYRIIDLECLSYSNPYLELYELALCWTGYEECAIDFELFRTFIQAYMEEMKEYISMLPIDWEVLYDSNYRRLEWLEYNIKRVLGIDCGEDEKDMGIQQVRETMAHVIYYYNAKEQILECLASIDESCVFASGGVHRK